MADLRVKCPNPTCGFPEQHVGMRCEFCGEIVPMPRDMVAPDGTARVEEVIGYRGWRIRRNPDGTPELHSPLFSLRWIPGQWMVAECQGTGRARGANGEYIASSHGPDAADAANWSPVKGCGGAGHGCGFYAGRTREHLIELGYGSYSESDPHVIGRVQMAGKIIPATNGWRAQRCRPRTIYVPYEFWELGRDLREVYGPHGVEVELGTTIIMPREGADAIQWCKRCSAKMGRGTSCDFCGHTHT